MSSAGTGRDEPEPGSRTLEVEPHLPVVDVAIRGYADMPKVHGLTIVGWTLGAVALAGAEPKSHRLTQRPWPGVPRSRFGSRRDEIS